jgi:hypothetical protein
VLPTPVVKVYMDDGSVLEVQALNKDLLTFDRLRARRGWPTAADAPQPWITFIGWTALTREGLIPKMTLDEFEERALAVTVVTDKEDGTAAGADPTQQDREPS